MISVPSGWYYIASAEENEYSFKEWERCSARLRDCLIRNNCNNIKR